MFARAIGDPNPIDYNETYARKSDVGRITARLPSFRQPDFSTPATIAAPSGASLIQ